MAWDEVMGTSLLTPAVHVYSRVAMCQRARPLGAAAHPVNELIRGNAVGLEDFRGELQVNWIRKHSQSLFGELGESRPAQHVNYILPSTLHYASRPSLT